MKFEKITRQILESVANQFSANDIPAIKSAKKYTVGIGDKDWPVKFIIQKAFKEAYGKDIGHNEFSSKEARSYLKKLDFHIDETVNGALDRSINALINEYIKKVSSNNNKDEIYKWKLIKTNLGKPDLKAVDFEEEIRNVQFGNLVYGVGIGAIRHLARDRSEKYRQLLAILFNEDESLTDRIKEFSTKINELYRQLVPDPKLSHHHDERTISTLLTFHNPSHYALFKDSIYQKFCKLLDQSPKGKNEKFTHYLDLLNDFIDEYIIPNKLLIETKKSFLTSECYEDANHYILAQDILFQQLEGNNEDIDIGDASVFKISMGSFDRDEFDSFIDKNIILVHSTTKAKASSSQTQSECFSKEIQIGDYFYLTHGNNSNGVTLMGRIISDSTVCELEDYARDGWLQRKYEPIIYSMNQSKYSGKQFWWTPNDVSTCIKIKSNELKIANTLIFNPYFKTTLINNMHTGLDQQELAITRPKNDLNTILYGPPGTGKTFNSINKSLMILGENTEDLSREGVKKKFSELQNDNRLFFTTFHQNMSYEDFIEGIKPKKEDDDEYLKYEIQEGLFMKACIESTFNYINKNFPNNIQGTQILTYNQIYDKLFEEIEQEGERQLSTRNGGNIIISVTGQGNFSAKHSKGEGDRSYTVSRDRLGRLFDAFPEPDNIANIYDEFRRVIGGSNATVYWSVLKVLYRMLKESDPVKGEVTGRSFEDKKKIVQSFWNSTDYFIMENDKSDPYVFII